MQPEYFSLEACSLGDEVDPVNGSRFPAIEAPFIPKRYQEDSLTITLDSLRGGR